MMEFISILFLFAGFFATFIAALNMAFTQENFLFLSFSGCIDDDNGCWIPFVLETNHKVTNMIQFSEGDDSAAKRSAEFVP